MADKELIYLQQFKDKEEIINNKINQHGYEVKVSVEKNQVCMVYFSKISNANKYQPDIYYDSKNNQMTIQTVSYGELPIDECFEFVQYMNLAMNACHMIERYFLLNDAALLIN